MQGKRKFAAASSLHGQLQLVLVIPPSPNTRAQMLKFGIPMPAAQLKMMAEGLDPLVLECDPEKPLPKRLAPKVDEMEVHIEGPPLSDHPEYGKYFKVSLSSECWCCDGSWGHAAAPCARAKEGACRRCLPTQRRASKSSCLLARGVCDYRCYGCSGTRTW